MNEIWKPIVGWDGLYEVSSLGRVKRVARTDPRGVRHPEMVLKVSVGWSGYPTVWLQLTRRRRKVMMVHRAIAEAFIPNHDGKPHVNHIDGDKTNSVLSNLEWVTPAENNNHAHRMGLVPPSKIGPGTKGPAAKLTEDKVREIKRRLAAGEDYRKIAPDYGVVAGTIGHIKYGKTWTHV
jgi:hypothetical protein